jgi:uncharacterized protein YdhG (YjbR/CyaY superfamily)
MKTGSAQPTTIDDYIAGFPPSVQRMLQEMRRVIRTAAPDAEEAIKYRIPTFVLNENHVGFYPTPSGIEAFQDDLSAYHSAKGSVQFPLDEPLPLGLVRKIVKFRVKEVREKLAAKAKRTKRGRASLE